MQETWVRFWGQEDPLEKEMAAHSGILIFLPGKFHGQRSLEGYSPRCHKTWTRLATHPLPPHCLLVLLQSAKYCQMYLKTD